MLSLSVPLAPRRPGGALQVLVIGRISTEHQNLENIEASYRYVETFLGQQYHGPLQLKYLGERASGMLAQRATIREAEELIASEEWDLVIAEDLSRIFRNPRHQYNFVQDAVDVGTRVICIGDNLDTADENWEIMMGAATLRHGMAIPDIRRRVRRTATHSFHGGGMVLKVKYGYRKLTAAEAASGHFGPVGLRIVRRPECTPVIEEMRQRVLRGQSYATIADWLRRERIETPAYARGWSARLVKDLLQDPILVGKRTFRKVLHQPIFRTGLHRRIKNADPETIVIPELAHLSEAEYAELLQAISRRGQERDRPAPHPRRHQPRSRVLWPGQLLRCGICQGLMYCFGDVFKCQNARPGSLSACWNHVQVPVALARERSIAWMLATLCAASGFRKQVVAAAQAAFGEQRRREAGPSAETAQRTKGLEAQAERLAEAIARGGPLAPLVARLQQITATLAATRSDVKRTTPRDAVELSLEEIDSGLDSSVLRLAETSFELADLLRPLVLEAVVIPVQALDTPAVRPRLRLALQLPTETSPAKVGLTEIDLFDPPLHIRWQAECTRLRQPNPQASYDQIAERLGLNRMTVKRALEYGRRMAGAGVSDPYRPLAESPSSASRWSRPATTGCPS